MPSGFTPASVLHQTVPVRFEYPVVFCNGCLAPADEHLAWAVGHREPGRRHPIVVCVDDGVARAWPQLERQLGDYVQAHSGRLELRGPIVSVPGGEVCKNDPRLTDELLTKLAHAKLDRHGCVVAIGGGAVLDAVGYAAALVHRGLRLVRLPTTVLAQNDAGVGVKNGVNAFGSKNFLGTFAPPFAVVNDAAFLTTLPQRDIIAGLAEAVKVACIRDAEFFAWLERNSGQLGKPGPELDTAVQRCAELHLAHISTSGDPFEMGSARPLDYGHWAAHKLEVLSKHQLRHGEAVAIGMLLDARYAERKGMLGAAELERLRALLHDIGLPSYDRALELTARDKGVARLAVLAGLEEFREHLGGQLTITLLERLGRGVEVHAMDEAAILEAIGWLRSEHEQALPASAE